MGLEGLENRQAQQVSGGQLQRACICRSLINDPVVLFADEPTGDLNRQAAQEVMDTLVNLNRQGMSILMVTHDSKTASRCDRILYLQDGEIKDQLHLERDDADREQRVNDWLMQRDW
nr:ATP-binding cassette domain-containing protein [Faecalibaculum rodentium]